MIVLPAWSEFPTVTLQREIVVFCAWGCIIATVIYR